jgi:hypothetical protein
LAKRDRLAAVWHGAPLYRRIVVWVATAHQVPFLGKASEAPPGLIINSISRRTK